MDSLDWVNSLDFLSDTLHRVFGKKEVWVMDVRISRIFTRFSRIEHSKIRENLVKIREIRTSITHISFFVTY
jgi:hypothetical protein